jgi:hypothetical protein
MRSGATIYLGSGEQTGELPEHEIVGNARIEALRERGVITVQSSTSQSPRSASGRASGKAAKTDEPHEAGHTK